MMEEIQSDCSGLKPELFLGHIVLNSNILYVYQNHSV